MVWLPFQKQFFCFRSQVHPSFLQATSATKTCLVMCFQLNINILFFVLRDLAYMSSKVNQPTLGIEQKVEKPNQKNHSSLLKKIIDIRFCSLLSICVAAFFVFLLSVCLFICHYSFLFPKKPFVLHKKFSIKKSHKVLYCLHINVMVGI